MGEGDAAARLGHGRDARLRDAGRPGLRRAPVGTGHRRAARSRTATRCCTIRIARNGTPGIWVPLQHIKRRAARLRSDRLGAVRGGGAGIRVRLRDLRAEQAGRMGSAVRRLRQRRAGRHRPVHCRRRSQMGPRLRAHLAAAARLRGPGPRAFVGAARALSAIVRGAQHAGLRADDAGADLPPAAPADGAQLPQAADRDEPEEPAAAQGSGVDDGGARRTENSRRSSATSTSSVAKNVRRVDRLQRQGLLRSRWRTGASRRSPTSRSSGSSSSIRFRTPISSAEIAEYPNATEVVWCQEEPQNQGAWYRLRAYLRADIADNQVLAYAGRPISASPAVGYMSKHLAAAEAGRRGCVRRRARLGRDGDCALIERNRCQRKRSARRG